MVVVATEHPAIDFGEIESAHRLQQHLISSEYGKD